MQDAAVKSDPDIGGKRRNGPFAADAQLGLSMHTGELTKHSPDHP